MAKKKTRRASDQADSAVKSEDDFAFEPAMERIEEIVESLESGKLDLGESLQQYEFAIGQLKHCHEYLESAERQVRLLAGVDEDGNPITEPLHDVDSDDLAEKRAGRSARRGAPKPATEADGGDGDDDLPGLF